jgi:hypothetical protein
MLLLFLTIIIFLLGLYFFAYYGGNITEGLTNNTNTVRCPNMLIQKGSKFYLYNSNIAQVPGINPTEFQNLEDYTEFLDWQRSQGIICPVLYLQHSYDIQGNPVYKIRPSTTDLQGGLPPSSTTIPTSINIPYINPMVIDNSMDKSSTLEQQQQENLLYSPNAMDANWGGADYTQHLVDEGVYKGNEVNIRIA